MRSIPFHPNLPSKVMPLLLLFLLLLPSAASSFSLDFFPGDAAIAQLALSGANATSTGAISMRSPHARVQYHKPITFSAGFSTYFSFSLSRTNPKSKTASLAFFLAPASSSRSPNALLAVVFAADPSRIRIRIELAGDMVVHTPNHRIIPFSRTQKLHSWIDYNATSATLQVRLSAKRLPKPPRAHLSYSLHLSALLPVLAGFASSDANCTLFSWAFRANHRPPYLMHSQPLDPTHLLTTPPPDRLPRAPVRPPRYRYPSWVSLLFAAACGALLTFFVLFAWYSVGARRPVAPVEYPMHPSDDIVYEKIVLVGVKDLPTDVAAAGNK